MSAHTCTHTHAYTYTHAHMYTHTYTCAHTRACTRTHARTHTHAHMRTHTDTHTRTSRTRSEPSSPQGTRAGAPCPQPDTALGPAAWSPATDQTCRGRWKEQGGPPWARRWKPSLRKGGTQTPPLPRPYLLRWGAWEDRR